MYENQFSNAIGAFAKRPRLSDDKQQRVPLAKVAEPYKITSQINFDETGIFKTEHDELGRYYV